MIDGGSTDGTVEYVRQSNLISRIIPEPDKGIYDTLNKGIRMATGDIIGFLHSDDLFASPHTLENIVCAFTTSGILGKEKDSFRINDDQASFPPFGGLRGAFTGEVGRGLQ